MNKTNEETASKPKEYLQPHYKVIQSPVIINQIVCKHSIIMLLLFHQSQITDKQQNKTLVGINKCSFFFKKSKIKYFTLLRAPYRYKIARNQIMFKRFFFRCSLIVELPNLYTYLPLKTSTNNLKKISLFFEDLYQDLSTNICIQNNVITSVPFQYTNFFILKNYH